MQQYFVVRPTHEHTFAHFELRATFNGLEANKFQWCLMYVWVFGR